MRSATLIRVGMPVYGVDEELIGPVEGLDGTGLHVGGHHIPSEAIARVSAEAIHLRIGGVALRARHARETV
jgi:hypothetical protein